MAWNEATAKKQLKRDKEVAKLGHVGKRVKGTSGRCTVAVDQETYIHAIETNGGTDANGKTCWDNPEWVNDQKRKHPHLREPGDNLHHNYGKPTTRTRMLPDGRMEEINLKTGKVRRYRPDRSKVIV